MTIWINSKDAVLREIEIAEEHLHNREIWFGSGAVEDSLTSYQLISGNGVFGAAVLILDTTDTPVITGNNKFDMHRIVIDDLSETTQYLVRFIWGTGTVEAAETEKHYSTTGVISTGIGVNVIGLPSEIIMPQLTSGTKVWARCKNISNAATIDFMVGFHEYRI